MKKIGYLFLVFGIACSTPKKEKAEKLYNTHCASCHIAPSPTDLPKHLWSESVLPEMAARMGIKDSTYSPYAKYSFREQEAIMRTGLYNVAPQMSQEEWVLLKEYIIESAPEKIDSIAITALDSKLSQFVSKPVNLDSIAGSSITYLDTKSSEGIIVSANLAGKVSKYDYLSKKTVYQDNFEDAVTSFTQKDSVGFVTMVGNLNPSEIANGKIYQMSNSRIDEIAANLHRPVYTSVFDLNKDGSNEVLVSEFGHLTGMLSLWSKEGNSPYRKRVLLGQPGVVRTIVKDMNSDGKADVIALTSQGNEGVTILYQEEDLNFRSDQVIRFNPLYGSSWFDLVDYNNDGFYDIITVHGDNADNTYVKKSYHGMRVYLNNGENQFEEKYFYPLYGATRFVANDFDQDGDLDIGIVSSFPDYEKNPEFSFVYLENLDSENFKFEAFGLENPSLGRWLLMDTGDIDRDGDEDIILSSFTYYFTPVPDYLYKQWFSSDVDLMVLENQFQ
ncbi:FG-GAP repeat domain-containing protein [Maribacter sp. 2308TA10-17]|uniref:FG-GAP repeat domain-containing protein n=1 Tax=Maribacter sp. 2308TA10-17 TaxID=3386276 RepID=UPI0039BD7D88